MPMTPTRSMTVSAMTPAAWTIWSRAVFRAVVKLARSGSSAGLAVGGVDHRGAQQLVDDEQGVDLLVDAVGGAGAQDASAQDRGFEFEVGGLDFPALVVKPDQFGGRDGCAGSSRVVMQPVAAGVGACGGGDADLRVDDPDRQPADDRGDRIRRGGGAGPGVCGRSCSGSAGARRSRPGW